MINDFVTKEDLSLFTSGGRLGMGAVFLKEKKERLIGTFDLFVRELPPSRNYLVFAGLEHVVDFLLNFKFNSKQLFYLKKAYGFDSEVLNYYKKFKFTGDVYAMPEGTLCFPNEPVIRITAPIIEGIIIEQYMINTVMLQTMLASKMARVMSVVGKRKKFGVTFNRTHGIDSAMKAVRVGKIVGVQLVALPLAAMKYKSYQPEGGVMAHYFVMAYPDEISAFRAYAKHFGSRGLFLVDTYDIKQGIKNFIKVAKEMEKQGTKLRGIIIDSGDLCKLSKMARKMLDKAGLNYIKIVVMSDLNEYKIKKLEDQKASVDIYGAATEILNVVDAPKLEVVYKISEIREGKRIIPKMKLAHKKISLPGRKQVVRVEKNNKYVKDVIELENEKIKGKKLLIPYIRKGKIVRKMPTIEQINQYHTKEKIKFDEKIFDINKKIDYPVKLSNGLIKLINKTKKEILE